MSIARCLPVAAVLVALCCCAPAGAVVGGAPATASSAASFVSVSGCGGTLVSATRVVTAAHCVHNRTLSDFTRLEAGAARPQRIAMPSGWQATNGTDNRLDDIAIVEFDRPLSGVTPMALGTAQPGSDITIVGAGRTTAPGSAASVQETFGGGLREAALRVMSDRECAAAWRGKPGNDGERFNAARMVCAIDRDGLAPLSSGCNGDSGGPMIAETPAGPVLAGVVSWGAPLCGADHLPSVFTEVDRYRDFITDPSPTWMPLATGSAKVTGSKRVGGKLRCAPGPHTETVTKTSYAWKRIGGRQKTIGRGPTYEVRRSDRGGRVTCFAEMSNAGGNSITVGSALIP